MKILVLIHEFPPIGGGGGHVALDLGRELVKRGHDIVLITSHFKDLEKEEWIDGMRIIRVPALRNEAFRASFLSMSTYIATGLWACFRLLKKWRPDVIHVHFAVPAGGLAWAFSRLTKIPYVLTAHLGDVPGGAPEKTDRWFRWIFPLTHRIWRDAKQIVAVSKFTRQLALKHYPVDIKVIYNGVDVNNLKSKELNIHKPPRIVFAGRFAEQKNPLQIVRTLAALKDLPWQIVMIGDGQLRERIETEVRQHGMQDRFLFTGWITPTDVLDWFSKSDILFMPSFSEGLPVVGVQALAMGLALVVSHIGGFVDLVAEGKNGFLVDKNRPADFAERLKSLLTSEEKLSAFRQNSRREAAKFALSSVVQNYEKIYENCFDESDSKN